jgi:hypothetical protein
MFDAPATLVTSRDSTHPRYGSSPEFTPTLFMTTHPAPGDNGSDYVACRSAVVVEHNDTEGMSSDYLWTFHPQYREASNLSMRLHQGISALMERRSKLPDTLLGAASLGFTTPFRALFNAEARQDLVDLTNQTAYGPLSKACTDQLARMTKEDPAMSTCQIVWSEWSEFEANFPQDAESVDAELAKLAGTTSVDGEQSSSGKTKAD